MNLQFLNKANQYVIVMFKYLQTKSNRFVNDLKTKKLLKILSFNYPVGVEWRLCENENLRKTRILLLYVKRI